MSQDQLPEHIREQVKRALTHYASFYAELVGNNPDGAEENLTTIANLDRSVKASEDDATFHAYYQRRSQLMRIFQFQLKKTIEGQVQQEILDQAETLISKLEVLKS